MKNFQNAQHLPGCTKLNSSKGLVLMSLGQKTYATNIFGSLSLATITFASEIGHLNQDLKLFEQSKKVFSFIQIY